MSAPTLESLGIAKASEAKDDAFARILLLGPAKLGKTTSICLTAPDPLVINCDGVGATVGAAEVARRELGEEWDRFKVLDAYDVATWRTACINAKRAAEAGLCKTIVVDTITLMQDALITDLSVKFEGFELWREIMNETLKGVRLLKMAPAHLFVVAHMIPGSKDETEGILPLIAGQSAQRIPAMLHDTVLFVYDESRGGQEPVPHRFFALGPQGTWRYGGRHIKHTCQIPADVMGLFEEMGITP